MDIKESLTRKVGPLPMWGWGAIVIGLIIGYSYYKNRGSSTTSAATDSTGGTPGAATYSDANGTYPAITNPRGSDFSGSPADSTTTSASDASPWSVIPDTAPTTLGTLTNVGTPGPTGSVVAPAGTLQRPTTPRPFAKPGNAHKPAPNHKPGRKPNKVPHGNPPVNNRPTPTHNPKPAVKPNTPHPGANTKPGKPANKPMAPAQLNQTFPGAAHVFGPASYSKPNTSRPEAASQVPKPYMKWPTQPAMRGRKK